jgi:radical SAM superfamily enzyme YgiQ (UPF0313 family)
VDSRARTAGFRHVLCVYPYRVGLRRNLQWPPLGLELVAAALGPHAEAVDVIDLRKEPGRTADFLRPDTDLVCFSVNWDRERDFVRDEIRSVPDRILTVVGGRHATEDPERWLADCPNVNVLVRGDGEEAVEELARGTPLDGIAGISYRLNGTVAHGPVRHPGPVADDLYPDRRLRRYVYSWTPSGYRTSMTLDSVASSRGCPFNCSFCSFNRNPWGAKRNWSARSPESVVHELQEVDARGVIFVDDNFTHDMDRVGAICDLIEARGIRKRYVVNARVEIAKRPDVLRKMGRAGFSILLLGIESAQDRTLRSMRKGFDTRRLREYFRVLRKTRMILHGYFIIGNIGETEEEMLAIGPFARELGLDTVSLCRLRSERYSGIEELVAASPGYHVAPDGKVYSDEYPPERLTRIRNRIYTSFYRPGQILHVLGKLFRNGLLTPGMLTKLPAFLVRGVLRLREARPAGREAAPSRATASPS